MKQESAEKAIKYLVESERMGDGNGVGGSSRARGWQGVGEREAEAGGRRRLGRKRRLRRGGGEGEGGGEGVAGGAGKGEERGGGRALRRAISVSRFA